MNKNSSERQASNAYAPRPRVFSNSDVAQSITSLGALPFWKAFWDIIECHYVLWREGVQHGDISISNLSHRNGTGVLTDFDYTSPNRPQRSYRTSPTAFLALELSPPKPSQHESTNPNPIDSGIKIKRRQYRHDLESFFWVLIWICTCYKKNVLKVPDTPYHMHWIDWDKERCRVVKGYVILRLGVPVTRTYRALQLGGAVGGLQGFWRGWYEREKAKLAGEGVSKDLEPGVEELEDVERVLFDVLAVFEGLKEELQPDISPALFPNYGKVKDGVRVEGSESAGGVNHG